MSDLADTNELLTFTRIVETQSLSRAASELGVPRITVGRRLQRLEERLGVRLLRRTTRKLALTDAGKEFYPNARAVVDSVRQAEASVRRPNGEIRGTIRVATPPMLGSALSQLFTSFMKKHPAVRIEVHATAEFVDLVAGGFDLALRASTRPTPGVIGRVLSRSELVACASPAYLKRAGTPKVAADLANHACLLGFERGIVPQSHWPLRKGGRIRVEGVLMCNEISLLAQAALDAFGIALLPDVIVASSLRRGKLVRVLEEVIGVESQISVVYPERELMPPATRAFIDHVVAWSKKGLRGMEEQCSEALGA